MLLAIFIFIIWFLTFIYFMGFMNHFFFNNFLFIYSNLSIKTLFELIITQFSILIRINLRHPVINLRWFCINLIQLCLKINNLTIPFNGMTADQNAKHANSVAAFGFSVCKLKHFIGLSLNFSLSWISFHSLKKLQTYI